MHPDIVGLGVLHGIVQSLLCDAQQLQDEGLLQGRGCLQLQRPVKRGPRLQDTLAGAKPQICEGIGQAVVQIAQGVDHQVEIGHALGQQVTQLMLREAAVLGGKPGARELRPESIVQVLQDAFALFELGLLDLQGQQPLVGLQRHAPALGQ